jgi:PKD repeat protein
MKKISTKLAVLFTVIFGSVQAQTHWCDSDPVNNSIESSDANVRAARQQLEDFTEQYTKSFTPSYFRSSGVPVYIIPVVFHVIHNYGPENISDAQIYDAMRIINRDYQGLRTDTANIYQTFKALNADIQVEFRLARLDPNGNCTNGIERIQSTLTNAGGDASKFNPWPYNKYLNIWTVAQFDSTHAGAAAYAYYPGAAPAGKDGVISLASYVGSIGLSNTTNQYTLTHEIGHCLNLRHTWGSTNQPGVACGDDNVSDTPITKGFTSCPQPANAAICTPGVVENYQNYMDYSYCYYMFTNGQKARMWAALNSSVGLRNQLYTTNNLLATGTDGGTYVCVPTALFGGNGSTQYICEGQTVTVTDQSLNTDSTGTTYTWFSAGANPSTLTGKSVTLTFPTAGVYDITLTVTNSAGSDAYTRSNYVYVSALGTAPSAPIIEGFETITLPGASDWIIFNQASTSNTWETTSATAYTGQYSMKLQNFSGNSAGSIDEIITPAFSLANTTATKARFRVSFANRSTTSSDLLRVLVSTDCGQSWAQRYAKTASQLATVSGTVASNFVPSSLNDWRLDSVNLGAYSNNTNIRLKFEYTYYNGNNLYIDDINISGTVGLNDIVASNEDVTLIPNPATASTTLSIELIKAGNVSVAIVDVLGKEIKKINEGFLHPGMHQMQIETPFPTGFYFVRVAAGNQIIIKKLIIK